MALVTTTLASAASASDQAFVLASATSVAEGRVALVDGEFVHITKAYVTGEVTAPVARGQEGTAAKAHASGAEFTHGEPEDWAQGPPGSFVPISPSPVFVRVSYSAAGAIALPDAAGEIRIATLNGTDALAMTVAAPDEAVDGSILIIVGNGKAAHTATFTGGLGAAGSGYTVGTYATGGQGSLPVIASGGVWVPLVSPLAGTLTGIDISIA
jgi:hypothetical protein